MKADKRAKRGLSFLMAGLVAFSAIGFRGTPAYAMTRDDTQDILDIYTVDPTVVRYADYVSAHKALYPNGSIVINAKDYSSYTDGETAATPEILSNYEGVTGDSVITAENAVIEYEFNVTEEGFYSPVFTYFPIKGKSASIQRAVFIDGNLPYRELGILEFTRVWQNKVVQTGAADTLVWEKDNQGNDLKPAMVESPEWIRGELHDSDGYIPRPLTVYLTQGKHTITIHSVREPMLLRTVSFESAANDYEDTYADVKATLDIAGAKDTSGVSVKIETESAIRTSSQMLYPTQNQGSPSISPVSAKTLLNNTIGGNSWRLTGQWIEWDFEVPQTGYYLMSAHANQSFKRGIYVSRKISIDGEVPFSEFSDYGFTYNQNWKQVNIADSNGDSFRVYLTQGKHTLRMEAVLGNFAGIISEARSAVYDLNSIYRQVIKLTGVAPDKYRDYQIERSLPALTAEMEAVRDNLSAIINELQRVAGRRSDRERVLVTMRDQLNDLIKDNEKFGKQIGSFKVNVRACGTWLNEAMSQPLQLDSITFYSPDQKVTVENNSIFAKISHEIQRLFYSFVIDYNAIGNIASKDEQKAITLWIGSGRDQANVIKEIIDETFTSVTGVSVNVMLVDMSTLLQATLAGQGPDVSIQVGWDLPMNYGLRDAVLDLSRFPDLADVKKRFMPSALTPYEYNGATYGLPETQVFPMMFYRKDIIAEMGLTLPETWDDVSVMLAVLARSQMEIGMLPSESLFSTLLYQNGGQYYNADATRSALDSDEAINAFKKYSEFYTDYKLDRQTSVEERFRTGECPIIIADYTVYNNLQVSAPDLRGIWGMLPVPGTIKEDGTIDRSVGSYGGAVAGGAGTGGACIIMQATDKPEICWEFLKWWTDAPTQTAYGREMESLMGSSARIPTANLEAFDNMPWPAGDLAALKEQFSQAKGIPQVPGGYFSFRNVNNAFYSVTTPPTDRVSGDSSQATPREALTDKVILINDEIRYKRTEFGLPLDPTFAE
ncbi:ABC transporter substrate-binding protein [Clostridia bacterium]|nr:ABC transporter substrate-binding protein [Clostridia bacterium]